MLIIMHVVKEFPASWSWNPEFITVFIKMIHWITLQLHPTWKTLETVHSVNKNQVAWNFVRPAPEVTCCTIAIIIPVVLLLTFLCIPDISLPSIH
jgi:hypothetical protein